MIETHRGNSASGNQPRAPEPIILASFNLLSPLPAVPARMLVYKTVDPQISSEDIAPLMNVFSLEGDIIDRERQFVVREGERVLEVFKEPGTGYVRFSNDAKLGSEEEAKNLPSEEEAVGMAEEFLRASGLLPGNSFFAGSGYYEFREYGSDGEVITWGKSGLAVGFGFLIEEMEVKGPGAKASVVFGEEGDIIGASKIWREIEPDEEREIIIPEEAFAAFKQRWPQEAEPEELEWADIITEVTITEVYVAYYAEPGCLPQHHMEPVYVFRGNYHTSGVIGEQDIGDRDYFEIIIPAIPEI